MMVGLHDCLESKWLLNIFVSKAYVHACMHDIILDLTTYRCIKEGEKELAAVNTGPQRLWAIRVVLHVYCVCKQTTCLTRQHLADI